jgi:cytochrome c oxidase subunit 2
MTRSTTLTTAAARVAGFACTILPFALVLVAASAHADSTRVVDVTLSRYAFSPERIEVRVGEQVRLNVASADGPHGFQVKALGLKAHIPAGETTTVDVAPNEPGTFEITCSTYCGIGHRRMKAWLVVTPGP